MDDSWLEGCLIIVTSPKEQFIVKRREDTLLDSHFKNATARIWNIKTSSVSFGKKKHCIFDFEPFAGRRVQGDGKGSCDDDGGAQGSLDVPRIRTPSMQTRLQPAQVAAQSPRMPPSR